MSTVQNAEDHDNDAGLNGSSSRVSIKKLLLPLLAGLLIIAAAIAFFIYQFAGFFGFSSNAEKNKTPKNFLSAPDTLGQYRSPPPPLEEILPEAPPPLPEPIEEETPTIAPPPPLAVLEESENPPPSLLERRLAASVAAYQPSKKPEVPIPERQVKVMKNVDYTLIKGTKIPCTLETAIVSEQQGFVSCIISQDVYSSNARLLLIEKGAKVTGEYNTGLKNGESRLGIVWDRLITPYDVVMQLDSPSTGRLGAAGVKGRVDNRWGTRIGSALLVSLFDDALQIVGKNSKDAQVFVDSSTAESGQKLATEILKKNIDLPPIVYITEGEMINIYVADDIDLSSIYSVR